MRTPPAARAHRPRSVAAKMSPACRYTRPLAIGVLDSCPLTGSGAILAAAVIADDDFECSRTAFPPHARPGNDMTFNNVDTNEYICAASDRACGDMTRVGR